MRSGRNYFLVSVDQLTPGYYCTLPRNIARRQRQADQGATSGVITDNGMVLMSRNPSLDGDMNEVDALCRNCRFLYNFL